MSGLLFFDTETTGKFHFNEAVESSVQPHICQLAALLTDTAGNELSYFTALICPTPEYNFSISPEAQGVHGLSMQQCRKFGVHINAAMLLFNQLMMNSIAAVAHNIDFDNKMIAATCHRIDRPNRLLKKPNICTMKIYTPIVKLPPKRKGTRYKWPTLTETHHHVFNEGFEGAHDALVDVRACKKVYFELPIDERRKYEAGEPIPSC